jgi:hypothetical protein
MALRDLAGAERRELGSPQEEEPGDLARACRLVEQAADALAYLHARTP